MKPDDDNLKLLEMMIDVESQLVIMRQVLVILTADRFAVSSDPEHMLRAFSGAISTRLDGQHVGPAEKVLVELDRFVSDVRRLLPK